MRATEESRQRGKASRADSIRATAKKKIRMTVAREDGNVNQVLFFLNCLVIHV